MLYNYLLFCKIAGQLVQKKKVVSMTYSSSTSSWKPWRWVRLGLILLTRSIYINSNLNPLTKFTGSNKSTKLKDLKNLPMEHLSNNQHNQHKNSHSYRMGHPVLILMESQWKLRQQYDENFPMEAKPLQNKH